MNVPLMSLQRHQWHIHAQGRCGGRCLDQEVLSAAVAVAQEASLFFAVGSSLRVYPAAGLVDVAVRGGGRLVIVNAEPTPYDALAAEVIREPIGTALPVLLDGVRVCDTE
jgi:NAD-dependent protein deacetylase/lipoamidase